MTTPANILRVSVDGSVVSRDFDLGAVESFDFETNAGNSYRALKTETGREQQWTVNWAASTGLICVGTVRHQKPWLIFGSSAYRYFRPGALTSLGFQNDLWNAVQSLAE
jgi:hypothetical protein